MEKMKMPEQMIRIDHTKMGRDTVPAVNARELYKELGIRKPFADWIKQHIQSKNKYWLENQDFMIFSPESDLIVKGRPTKEYAMSIEMAEHIAMMTRTSKGREVRNYFREARDELYRKRDRQSSVPIVKDQKIQMMIEMLVRQDQLEQRQVAVELEAQQAQEKADLAIRGQTWMTIRQYVAIHGLTRQLPPGKHQQQYGKYLTGYCMDKGLPVYKQVSVEGWNENTYPVWSIEETLSDWLRGRTRQLPMPKTP